MAKIDSKTIRQFRIDFPNAVKDLEKKYGITIEFFKGFRHDANHFKVTICGRNNSVSSIKDDVDLDKKRYQQIEELMITGDEKPGMIAKKIGSNAAFVGRMMKAIRIARGKALLIPIVIMYLLMSGCGIFLPSSKRVEERIGNERFILTSNNDTLELLSYDKDRHGFIVAKIRDNGTIITKTYDYALDGKNWQRDSTLYRTNYATDGYYSVEYQRDSVWVSLKR